MSRVLLSSVSPFRCGSKVLAVSVSNSGSLLMSLSSPLLRITLEQLLSPRVLLQRSLRSVATPSGGSRCSSSTAQLHHLTTRGAAGAETLRIPSPLLVPLATSENQNRKPSEKRRVRGSYGKSLTVPLTPRQEQGLLSRCFSSTPSPSGIVAQDPNTSLPGAVASADGAVGIPIDFDTASKIVGNESQIAVIELEPGQILRAESGAMMYMTDGVEMSTTTGGGLSAGFKRMLTGQNFFISDYTYNGPEGTRGTVALGTDFPSKILRLNLEDCGGKVVCQKGALMCASHTVNIEMEFTKNIKSGFFGGEGFVLQALTGQGDVFVKAGGTLIRRDLKEGETLRASAGCLVAFVDADYDVQMVQGFTNVIAGGEGLFMTTFTGPGTVWLQGQPPQRMISEIARRVPAGGGIGLAVPVPGMGGGGGGDGGGGGGGEPTQG